MMPIWEWKEKFSDERVCAVEADTEEEAVEKRDKGDWAYEHTVDFYSEELLSDMKKLPE